MCLNSWRVAKHKTTQQNNLALFEDDVGDSRECNTTNTNEQSSQDTPCRRTISCSNNLHRQTEEQEGLKSSYQPSKIQKLWQASAPLFKKSNMSAYGGGYGNTGTYSGRSAARTAPPTAKKHMLKLVILGDSG